MTTMSVYTYVCMYVLIYLSINTPYIWTGCIQEFEYNSAVTEDDNSVNSVLSWLKVGISLCLEHDVTWPFAVSAIIYQSTLCWCDTSHHMIQQTNLRIRLHTLDYLSTPHGTTGNEFFQLWREPTINSSTFVSQLEINIVTAKHLHMRSIYPGFRQISDGSCWTSPG